MARRYFASFGMLAALALVLAAPVFASAKAERVVVCTSVENREPAGAAASFPAATPELFCFSELTGAQDVKEITHVWYKDGKEVFRQVLPVEGEHWRTWSRKKVSAGSWKVVVLDQSGAELGSAAFTVG